MLNAALLGYRDDDRTPHRPGASVPLEKLAREDRLASVSLLSAGLAHEIANPLAIVLAALDAAHERVREMRRRGVTATDVDELSEHLELATICSGTIADILHDFQAYLRPEAAVVAPRADVKAAVERALRIARPRAGGLARLDVQLREVPAVTSRANPIVQVVLNLLLNAPEALTGRPRAENVISVRLDVVDGQVVIEVSDNGPGLSDEVRDRLFEPGVSEKAGRPSTGLGLAVSRALVRLVNGTISVTSRRGVGTTFLVTLPPAR